MTRPESRLAGPKGVGPRTPDAMDAVTSALIGLDRIASDCERKWGVGRLVTLCRDNARISFRKGWAQWVDAQTRGDVQAMLAIIEGLKKLWSIMAAQAEADGHKPLSPLVWETRLPDGRVLALVRTFAEAHAVSKDNRHIVVWSIEEIARVLPGLEALDVVKQEFPGCKVERLVTTTEGFAESWATSDPLHDILYGEDANIPAS